MASRKCPCLVIFAPTACGKTALAIDLFGKDSFSVFKDKAQVISADSQAVYRCMDIGTAKPSLQEREQLPHHLIDIVDPDQQFSVSDFVEQSDAKALEIWNDMHKMPVVMGGTGFYIRNFLLGLPSTPESSPEVRWMMQERLKTEGPQTLYCELTAVDPLSASRINPNDHYRICRALEVYHQSGKPLSSYTLPDTFRQKFDFKVLVLNRPKDELNERIALRVEKMFDEGLEEEVKNLLSMGYGPESPGFKAIGYSEFFVPGLDREQIREKIIADSRKYAKKQYTFVAGIPGARIIDIEDRNSVIAEVSQFFVKWGLSQ